MRNIFIADDHPLIRTGLEFFLKEKGYTIVGTEDNGRSALNFIIKHQPDIAMLDVDMPFLTGVEIARHCGKMDLNCKIVLITYHKNINFYLEAKKYNIYGYLLKRVCSGRSRRLYTFCEQGRTLFQQKN